MVWMENCTSKASLGASKKWKYTHDWIYHTHLVNWLVNSEIYIHVTILSLLVVKRETHLYVRVKSSYIWIFTPLNNKESPNIPMPPNDFIWIFNKPKYIGHQYIKKWYKPMLAVLYDFIHIQNAWQDLTVYIRMKLFWEISETFSWGSM